MSARAAARVLLIGDGQADLGAVAGAVEAAGHRWKIVRDVGTACALLRVDAFPVVVAALRIADARALTLLRAAGRADPPARVIFRFDSLDGPSSAALPAIRGGAFDCLDRSHDAQSIRSRVDAALREYHRRDPPNQRHPDPAQSRAVPELKGRADLKALDHIRAISQLAGGTGGAAQLHEVAARSALELTEALDAYGVDWGAEEGALYRAVGGTTDDVSHAALSFAREVKLAKRSLARPSGTPGLGALVGAPIVVGGAVTGVLVVVIEPAADASVAGRLLQSLADQVAIVQQMVDARAGLDAWCDVLLDTLITALELHDRNTGQHSRRVADLAVELALELGYEEGSSAMTELCRGALMHDVGKLGISVAMLLKTGPLTEEDWVEMRRHPEYGYRILREVPSLDGVAEAVYASHESWDGSGYPRGLSGTDIPTGARVYMLVDAWDAMTSDRPYRKAMKFEEARREILENTGTQFDPSVVEAFERLVARWDANRRGRESAA